MKAWMIGIAVAVCAVAFAVPPAEAARMGGGRSIGAQRSIAKTPPAAVPARPAQPTQQATPAGAQSQPASGMSRWAPLLGGLAIGGLLGALLGGSGFASMLIGWLMVGLVVAGIVGLARLLMRRRAEAARPMQYAASGAPGSYGSLGNETVAAPPPSQAAGFDARPVAAPSTPAGFDVAAFLRAAKLNFMKLQAANDAGALDELREFTTPELYEVLCQDVTARSAGSQPTEVVALNADLLEVVPERDRYWASVRFSGRIRDHPGVAPEGFEEVWNLCKPANGSSGWLLAGIQQMH